MTKKKSFDFESEIKRIGNTARITEADRQGQELYDRIRSNYFYIIEDKEGNVFKADDNGISKIIMKEPCEQEDMIIKVNFGFKYK